MCSIITLARLSVPVMIESGEVRAAAVRNKNIILFQPPTYQQSTSDVWVTGVTPQSCSSATGPSDALLKSPPDYTIVSCLLFRLTFIIPSMPIKSFGDAPWRFLKANVCPIMLMPTLGNAPHANMTPVAWQPDQQCSDPPLWAEQGPTLFTLISHYRTV